MEVPLSDVLFTCKAPLREEELERLVAALAEDGCVVSAHPGADHSHHFIKVAYNPTCISSQELLARLRKLGVEAEMIGL